MTTSTQHKLEELEKENIELKNLLEHKKKWEKINTWTSIIGSLILFLIIIYGLYKLVN